MPRPSPRATTEKRCLLSLFPWSRVWVAPSYNRASNVSTALWAPTLRSTLRSTKIVGKTISVFYRKHIRSLHVVQKFLNTVAATTRQAKGSRVSSTNAKTVTQRRKYRNVGSSGLVLSNPRHYRIFALDVLRDDEWSMAIRKGGTGQNRMREGGTDVLKEGGGGSDSSTVVSMFC